MDAGGERVSGFMEQLQLLHDEVKGRHNLTDLGEGGSKLASMAVDLYIGHRTLMQRMMKDAHVHAAFSFAAAVEYQPLMAHMILSEFANVYNVPVSWMIALPHRIAIDPAFSYVEFLDEDLTKACFEKDGSATEMLYAAYLDGKADGRVDTDEEFLFSRSEGAEIFSKMNADMLDSYASGQEMTPEEWVSHTFGDGKEDWSFPA